jgi:hypothetical protein
MRPFFRREISTENPWRVNPYRLWSLLDMERFDSKAIMRALGNLGNSETLISLESAVYGQNPSPPETTRDVVFYLEEFEAVCRNVPVSPSLRDQVKRLKGSIRFQNNVDRGIILRGLQEIRHNTEAELGEPVFFYVSSERRHWYHEDDKGHFGERVAREFPDSTCEISEALRCFAFDRWTAGVFHLMRALELALHKWATDLGVHFSAIELENWKNILDGADKKIRVLEQQPKSLTKDTEMTYYGETTAHFRSIKDAWRNHVAHARTTYNEQQGISILNHVREFMDLLSAKP